MKIIEHNQGKQMKIIEHTQGSEAWAQWRMSGIGASEISVLTGSNRYSTPMKLWEKKCGFREEDKINPAMRHGMDHEDIARQWLNDNLGLALNPLCIEDEEKSHYKASLDGFDVDSKTLVEIKCPVSEKVLDNARNHQAFPQYWLDQVQWQIMLCKPKRTILALWDYRYDECITIELIRLSDTQKVMQKKADEFWTQVVGGTRPECKDDDYIEVESEMIEADLQSYKEILAQEKVWSDKRKVLKKEIEGYADGNSFTCSGFKIKKCAPRSSYNLDQMRIDGIDVDKYLKKSETISYRITCPKD